jgi:hypothetical protein
MNKDNRHRTLTGDERAQLTAFLHDNRAAVAALLDGVTEEQARRRLVPSLTTLLGMVKHVAFAERVWFQVALAGRSRAEVGLPDEIDETFVLTDDDTIATIRADFVRACEESDAVLAKHALDDLALHNRRGPLTVRWIVAHLVEEHARHAGHGDILREQIFAADAG